MAKAVIRESAFMSMLASALEVYSKETLGVVLGSKTKRNYTIKNAIPFQSAKRNYDYTEVETLRENRINVTLKFLTGQKFIGDFHSHAGGELGLSDHDLEELEEAGEGFVSLLVFVKRTKRQIPWRYYAKSKSLAGTVGRKFFVKILAWDWNAKKEKAVPLRLVCPHLKKINKITKDYQRIEKEFKKAERERKKKARYHRRLKKLLE